MQAMVADGQISLDNLRAAAGAAGGVYDDFLDQMLGGLPPPAWPELASGNHGRREAAGWRRAGGGDVAPAPALRWGLIQRVRLAGVAVPAAPDQRRPCRRRRWHRRREADGAATAG